MKKFYEKFTKPITNNKMNSNYCEEKSSSSKRSSSGFYDLQEAQMEFDKLIVPSSSSVINMNSSDNNSNNSDDQENNADNFDKTVISTNNIDKNNGKFEYDVPRISFKFFERQAAAAAAAAQEENLYENNDEPILVKHIKKSEIHIKLQQPKPHEEEEEEKEEVEIFYTMKKSESDPNLFPAFNLNNQDKEDEDDDDDENFYKIPRCLQIQNNRLSLSLTNLQEIIPPSPPVLNFKENLAEEEIDHISVSQIQLNNSFADSISDENQFDYCTTRSKLPLKLRRQTLLKQPLSSQNKWQNFKSKMNNFMAEQAAQQKVGLFAEKSINFEELFKNSKNKCRKIFKKNIFQTKNRRKNSTNEISSSTTSDAAYSSSTRLKPSDIEYKLNISNNEEEEEEKKQEIDSNKNNEDVEDESLLFLKSSSEFGAIKNAFKKKLTYTPPSSVEGQNGFDDLKRFVKQGGDFCKELAAILQERAEAETQYAKSLSKLSCKLHRACRDGVGGLNEAWKAVALDLDRKAEAHRAAGHSLLEETAKPLRNLTEHQHRARKQCEIAVEKSARFLGDWRAAEAKAKKISHSCARDNEKLQDAAVIDTTKFGKQTLSKSSSLIQLAQRQNSADKENAKLEGKKKKAEDAVKKADIEYYTLCVRAERARLEWESSVLRGVNSFQTVEEERLNNLKTVLISYLKYNSDELDPRISEANDERLKIPIQQSDPVKDLCTFQSLRQNSQQISEQLLPDFYCEHITLAMNRERRKQALIKLLHLIRQDIERERKSKHGLENLSKAIKKTPNFGNEDSQQSVTEKLYHMKSMLTYLEAARYKVQSALAELDNRPRTPHPLAPHITITRDKSGLQQSILKVPQWLREEFIDQNNECSPVSEKSVKSQNSDQLHLDHHHHHHHLHINEVWPDRGTGDGNSNQPDSDFDEFSSQCSSNNEEIIEAENNVQPIAACKAIYAYTPNLTDELALNAGDILKVYRQQDDGWWLGECNGNVGIFPATYVEIIPMI